MKTLILKTLMLCILIATTDCTDGDDAREHEGNDTFSCYINGKKYIPTAGNGIGGGKIRPFAWVYNQGDSTGNNNFNIGGTGEWTLFINLINPKKGVNSLNQKLNDALDYYHSGMVVNNTNNFYNTKDNQNNGYIEFTELSKTRAIGTFECTLYDENNNELKVTHGKFNLSLETKKSDL